MQTKQPASKLACLADLTPRLDALRAIIGRMDTYAEARVRARRLYNELIRKLAQMDSTI